MLCRSLDMALPTLFSPMVVLLCKRAGLQEAEMIADVGATAREDGVELQVIWGDGFKVWVGHSFLKQRQHCLLKLADYYHSRIRRSRK